MQPTVYTADPRETTFLYQSISVAIQRFNAVCLANTLNRLICMAKSSKTDKNVKIPLVKFITIIVKSLKTF